MEYTKSRIFLRTLGEQPAPDEWADPRARLRHALDGFRKRAAVLAGEIHRDLPDFTVHDITHIDALWEMADLLAGPDYPLNPLEAFVLGGAFLLHDLGLGLAAWPEGVGRIKEGLGWRDALSAHLRKLLGRAPTAEEMASPPWEVERAALQDRLRALHAEHAERLADAEFRDPKGGARYHLIDDPDLRQALSPLLGRIAHSHWWPVSRLGSEFGTPMGALPDCPTEWRIDPLKIAVLLRTADAAHLDARRAPGFLRALRRPEAFSREHWVFQEHLNKPYLQDDRLVFTARAFSAEETDVWWLCQETLRMVDGELHQCDALLADKERPRLLARGVAGIESTVRLRQYIPVSGWTPVDARIHVSNVADLVKRLGGEQLYGRDQNVPLRELIQNASDAVRARRLLEDRSKDWGQVMVRLGEDEGGGPWLEVEDTGLGMSEAVLSGALLDFGTTYWGSALMREEHEGLWAKGFEPTGRFGIGFFSVFMWGHRVRVVSRPYRDGQNATRVMEFRTGIEARPIVRPARPEEQLWDGGTRVRVWLNQRPEERGGLLEGYELGALCAWLAPALDVDLWIEDENGAHRVVGASDWFTIEGEELILRLSRGVHDAEGRTEVIPLLQVLRGSDGRLVGRAAIFAEDAFSSNLNGVVTVGGLRAEQLGAVAGILLGATNRATRDGADPLIDASSLKAWASNQASLAANIIGDPWMRLNFAATVMVYGGEPGVLPIVKRGDEFIDFETLAKWKDVPDEVALYSKSIVRDLRLHSNVLGIARARARGRKFEHLFHRWINEALAQAWGCDVEEIEVPDGALLSLYEVGLRNDVSYKDWNVTVLRRPSGQRK